MRSPAGNVGVAGAKLIAVHTAPLWEDLATGERRVVLDDDAPPAPGRLIGWCNALEVRIAGENRMLLHSGAR